MITADSNQRLHATSVEADLCSFSLEFCDTDQRQLFTTSDVVGGCDSGTSLVGAANCTLSAPISSGRPDALQGVQFHYLHFETPSFEEKADWMASLLSLTTSR